MQQPSHDFQQRDSGPISSSSLILLNPFHNQSRHEARKKRRNNVAGTCWQHESYPTRGEVASTVSTRVSSPVETTLRLTLTRLYGCLSGGYKDKNSYKRRVSSHRQRAKNQLGNLQQQFGVILDFFSFVLGFISTQGALLLRWTLQLARRTFNS